MYLVAIDQTIEAVSDATATTTEPTVVIDYVDITTSAFTPGNSLTSLNGTTDVTIVGAPAASTTRQVKGINIFNADTVAHTVTVKHDDNGTERTLKIEEIAPNESLIWTPDGKWVNTADAGKFFTDLGDTPASYSGEASRVLQVNSGETALEFTDVLTLGDGTVSVPAYGFASDPDTGMYLGATGEIGWALGGVNALYLDGTGLGIGTESPSANLHIIAPDALGARFRLQEVTNSAYGEVRTEDITGDLTIRSDRGSSGTQGNIGFYPQNIVRMTLTPAGNLGIGTNSPNQKVHLHSTGGASLRVNFTNANTASPDGFHVGIAGTGDGLLWNYSNNPVRFAVNDGEVGRFDTSGNFLVGKDTLDIAAEGIELRTNLLYVSRDASLSGESLYYADRYGGVAGEAFQWRWQGSKVGDVTVDASSTSYNTSSDYRLKDNITSLDGAISRLMQLQPHRFNFLADPNKTVDGFVAHEAQTVVPEAVTGEKDAVDEDGNPVYQGIDQSKFVPLLTAALQEAVAEIGVLNSRVEALENDLLP